MLQRYGVDLARWVRDRRWRGLLELIEQLQQDPATALNEAILNNPEQADLIAARQELEQSASTTSAWSPRVAEYDLTAVMLREVIHALYVLRTEVRISGRRKPGTLPEFPAPVTEVDRAAARLERVWVDATLTRWGFDTTDL